MDKIVVLVTSLIVAACTYPLGTFGIKKILDKKYRKKEEEVIDEYKKNYDIAKDNKVVETKSPSPVEDKPVTEEPKDESIKDADVTYVMPTDAKDVYMNYTETKASNLERMMAETYEGFYGYCTDNGYFKVFEYSYTREGNELKLIGGEVVNEASTAIAESAGINYNDQQELLRQLWADTYQADYAELYFKNDTEQYGVVVYVD